MVDLDHHLTLKIFGYTDYETYLHDASCKRLLYNIKIPLFFINAEDDPMIGTNSYPIQEVKRNPNLLLGTTKSGGHIGYLTGIRDCYQWFVEPVYEYFNHM